MNFDQLKLSMKGNELKWTVCVFCLNFSGLLFHFLFTVEKTCNGGISGTIPSLPSKSLGHGECERSDRSESGNQFGFKYADN